MRFNLSDLCYGLQNYRDYFQSDSSVSAWWFTRYKNVGDLLGPYLLHKLTKRRINKNIFGLRKHILSVGSILDQATEHSLIWGAGAISKGKVSPSIQKENIFMLRGSLSQREIKVDFEHPLLLADPAMIVSEFYRPVVVKKWKVGIVPHYVDQGLLSFVPTDSDIYHIINIKQDVEPFIQDLLSCDFIFSSSLHGLIIADSYEIPNCWVRFDGGLFSPFKFYDYFSAFDGYPTPSCTMLRRLEDIDLRKCSFRRNPYLIDLVIRSFPGEFI